jgi:DNA polymerase-3 subunit beta
MKLKIEKETIQTALQSIQGIVDKKTTMPVLSHFLLKVGKTASILATDLDIALQGPLDAKISEKGSLCIPARKLFEIAREVEGDLLLESQENNWLKVKSGKSTFKLMGLAEQEYPALPEITRKDELSMESDTLRDIIEKTIFATGESDTRYTLNGLLMHFIPKKKKKKFEVRVVGTDGHRLSMVTKEIEGTLSEEKKLILPKKAAMELKRLLEGNSESVQMYLDKNHIFFMIGNIVLTSRLIEGTYPNYEQVIPQDNEKKAVLHKITFLKALRRISIMSRERTNAVRFDLETGKVTLSSINPDVGEAREEIAGQYKGDEISIGYNARYLIDILQEMEGENVMMELQEALSPTLLLDTEDNDYKCVIMPMRV